MRIYEALRKDHREFQGMLAQLIGLEEDDDFRFEIASDLKNSLISHSRAEEAVFYNSIRALDADSGKIVHGFKEHAEAEVLLRLLVIKEKVNLDWKATAKKLKEALDHHIQEEETQIFALGMKVLSDEDAERIGMAFDKMKPEIKKDGFTMTTTEMAANLMPTNLKNVLGTSDPF